MHRLLPGLLGLLVVGGCLSGDALPSGTPSDTLDLRPLPAGLAVPRPSTPTILREPQSRPGGMQQGVLYSLTLGHCGLLSPIDFDGSLWNQIAGDSGRGGPLSEDQRIELANSSEVELTLLQAEVAQLRTPLGAVIILLRNVGGRPYALCD